MVMAASAREHAKALRSGGCPRLVEFPGWGAIQMCGAVQTRGGLSSMLRLPLQLQDGALTF